MQVHARCVHPCPIGLVAGHTSARQACAVRHDTATTGLLLFGRRLEVVHVELWSRVERGVHTRRVWGSGVPGSGHRSGLEENALKAPPSAGQTPFTPTHYSKSTVTRERKWPPAFCSSLSSPVLHELILICARLVLACGSLQSCRRLLPASAGRESRHEGVCSSAIRVHIRTSTYFDMPVWCPCGNA